MTDPDLTPEQDAVRALLAEHRHDEPTPEAVVARLDATLAELSAERREVRPVAPVVELSARRRRLGGAALLAAAAVVVAGVGLGQVLDRTSGGSDSAGDSATSESSDRTYGDSAGAEDSAGVSPEQRESKVAPERVMVEGPALRSDRLRADLRRVRSGSAATLSQAPSTGFDLAGCVPGAADGSIDPAELDPGDVAKGGHVVVTLDGQPAVAVFAPATPERQRVDVYLCGTTAPARTLSLPAP